MRRPQKGPHHARAEGVGRRCEGFAAVRPKLRPVRWALCLLLGCAAGCGGGSLTVPTFSPDSAAQQALAEYDTNHDGYLDAKELERCPALKGSLKLMDQDGDGRLSAAEISQRLTMFEQSGVAITSASCRLFLNGRPLQGATVTYIPEQFLASAIMPASGVSDASGVVQLQMEGGTMLGANCGFYRVEISKKNDRGVETIPAKYNTQTILGEEVSPRKKSRQGTGGNDQAVFQLTTSK